jgi:hypothetical protein
VQLRLLRQRVVMAAQNAQADVLLHRLHYALPGAGGTPRRRGATRKTSSTTQPRQGGVGWRRLRCGPRLCFRRRVCARPHRGGDGGFARALAVYKPPPQKKRKGAGSGIQYGGHCVVPLRCYCGALISHRAQVISM